MTQHADNSWEDITQPEHVFEGARVIVVDDDDGMRDLVTTILESEGYQVQEAVSGDELMQMLEPIAVDPCPLDGVDLVLVDNRMPGLSGLEAIRRLRAHRPRPPMLLMTAFPEPNVRDEAAALGVPILPKPFSVDQLTTAILVSLLRSR